jgi:hypothetical protein
MKKPSAIATTATAALRLLWARTFFRSWRTSAAVEAELARHGYHFSRPELGMALMRAPHLTRKGRRGAYQYIQKHPFVDNAEKATLSEKRRSK